MQERGSLWAAHMRYRVLLTPRRCGGGSQQDGFARTLSTLPRVERKRCWSHIAVDRDSLHGGQFLVHSMWGCPKSPDAKEPEAQLPLVRPEKQQETSEDVLEPPHVSRLPRFLPGCRYRRWPMMRERSVAEAQLEIERHRLDGLDGPVTDGSRQLLHSDERSSAEMSLRALSQSDSPNTYGALNSQDRPRWTELSRTTMTVRRDVAARHCHLDLDMSRWCCRQVAGLPALLCAFLATRVS